MKAKIIMALVLTAAVVSFITMTAWAETKKIEMKPSQVKPSVADVTLIKYKCPPGWRLTQGSFKPNEITICVPNCPVDFKCPPDTQKVIDPNNCCKLICQQVIK